MEPTRTAVAPAAAGRAALLAKATLRRLALDQLEPTPENYTRAWRAESGEGGAAADAGLPERALRIVEQLAARALDAEASDRGHPATEFVQQMAQGRWEQAERTLNDAPAGDGRAVATLIEGIVRGLERVSKGWTSARKKDSLQRVLSGSRSDVRRLQQRLTQLVASWAAEPTEAGAEAAAEADSNAVPVAASATAAMPLDGAGSASSVRAIRVMGTTLQIGLPPADAAARELGAALVDLVDRIERDGASAERIDELEGVCQAASPVLQRRHDLLDRLAELCTELTASMAELAEDDSWAKGQCDAMRAKIDEGLTARGVRAVSELLRDTRERQGALRTERERARDALKLLINRMLSELDQLGSQTGHFHESVGRYADVIEKAETLESLTGVVREMVEESRTVQALVQQAQERLQQEHNKASTLTQRVSELELEMRRLSDEVSTDQLTQIANRRGLLQVFEVERERVARDGSVMSIGLLDIDNFKRLNDSLGHRAGDEALKALAAAVAGALRPTDTAARFGGEEFVVLLPGTPAAEGRSVLTRLQRSLSGALFMHEHQQVFVTFSAGVTAYRDGEAIEAALERADRALYEAKRTGKNRTCLG